MIIKNFLNSPMNKLFYFNARGKAEAIRLVLEDLQVPYKEVRYSMEEWKDIKPTLPFIQLPMYQFGEKEDEKLVQTQAILRHFGRKYDLYGKNEKERILVDIYQEAILDAREEIVRFFISQDFNEKRESFKKTLHTRLFTLNRFFEKNSGEFCLKNQITYVDYLLWVYLDYIRPFSQETLNQFPNLVKFKENFEKRKNIKNYLVSERRPKTMTLPHFKFGNTPETS